MVTITHNGATLATVNHGQCATLKCKGMKLTDDVTVNVAATCGDIDAFIDGSITEVRSNASRACAHAFADRRALKIVDLPNATKIFPTAFGNCVSLRAVILRCDSVCNLVDINAFDNCFRIFGTVNGTYNPNGDKDGYFYVPRASLSDDDATKDYRRATNWSTFGADRFRVLEDYTVDGTTTGAIDWDKVASGVQPATPEYLFKDEYIDSNGRTDLPSLYSGDYIGTMFTLVVDGEDIETKVFNGTDEADGTQWFIGSMAYELVFESGKEDVWLTRGNGFTCSLRIDS